MGATEEFRKRQGGEPDSHIPEFVPDPVVERALAASLQSAHTNWLRYQRRKTAYLKAQHQDG